jgi:general L-amino acid transport system permease protein
MAAPAKHFRWSWRSAAFRGLVYQILAVVIVVAAGWYLVHNTLLNMRVRGIQSGFDFLKQPAGFAISESLLEFDSADTYFKAYLTGLSNTLRVALLGIVLATTWGALVGIGRLSRNFLIRSLCTAYVEAFRNVPLLLQLFIWYFVLTEFLPPIDEALQPIPDVFFSKNGLQYPIPVWATGHLWMAAGIIVASSRRGTGRRSRAAASKRPVSRGPSSCRHWRSLSCAPSSAGSRAGRRTPSTSRKRPTSRWWAEAPSRRSS